MLSDTCVPERHPGRGGWRFLGRVARNLDSRTGDNTSSYEKTMVLDKQQARSLERLAREETAGVVLLTPIKTNLVPCRRPQ